MVRSKPSSYQGAVIKKRLSNLIKVVNKNRTLQIILVVLTATFAILLTLHLDLTQAKNFIQQNRKQAIPISIGVYFLMGFTPLPASPLTIFLAFMLGPVHAVLIAAVGNTLAALVEYRIGTSMANVMDFEAKKANLPFGLGKLSITSPCS